MTLIRTGTSTAWGQVPYWYSGTEMMTQQPTLSLNALVSANSEMRYQIIWTGTSVDEMYIPHQEGDIVNVVFNVYATTDYPIPAANSDWDLIGTIKKSRDLPNSDIVTSTVPNSQSFTIDISRIVADQLSYSLCPIGKGSWQSQAYGGMNGGPRKQDNITANVSPYNVTRNGSYRTIDVTVGFEVLDSNLQIVTSTTVGSGPANVRAINSVASLKDTNYLNSLYTLQEWSISQVRQGRALTRCPNSHFEETSAVVPTKDISLSDSGEFLQFYIYKTHNGNWNQEPMNLYEMFGTAYYKDSTNPPLDFVLGSEWPYPINNDPTNIGTRIQSDISHNFTYNTVVYPDADTFSDTQFNHYQDQPCVQNVSPNYINHHAYAPQLANYPYTGASLVPITSDTAYYKVYIRAVFFNQQDGSDTWQTMRKSNVYYYRLNDEEEQISYENVRFHWLNSMGGIDSYTARRNVLESISVEKTFMKSEVANRRYPQASLSAPGVDLTIKDYYSDTMRGYDTYKGGLEVLNVNTTLNNSVYTEPLNKLMSTWLREMFSSPNVWVEMKADTQDEPDYKGDFPWIMEESNPDLRPGARIAVGIMRGVIYAPVIINNTEIVSLDQEKGLVMYNIEYTDSFGVSSQNN